MSRFVCKFGGTSLADAAQFAKVKAIIEAEPRRQLIVPSAPGKRSKDDAKLTDLLYLCHQSVAVHASFAEVFDRVRARFLEIESALGLTGVAHMEDALGEVEQALRAGASRDFAASRGEYLCGRLLAVYLDADFVDPADFIVVSENGLVEPSSTQRLGARLEGSSRRHVVPGFYGRAPSGEIRTFSRGGSDITGAIVARAARVELYENWTDVSGLLMADPRIVQNPRRMSEVTYAEIRELAYMGASVLHDEAISPVREVGIPIEIRNTNAPDEPGTRITTHLSPVTLKTTEIAGIAGKATFSMISLSKSLMNKEVGFGRRLLGILEAHGVSFEHCPSTIDSMSVIVEAAQLAGKTEAVLEDIRRTLQPDQLELVERFALITVVGEEMAHTIGIAAKVFVALRDARVNVRIINQGASELSIIVGVAPDDFETAVRALYAAFVE